jgi:hypothetical protein
MKRGAVLKAPPLFCVRVGRLRHPAEQGPLNWKGARMDDGGLVEGLKLAAVAVVCALLTAGLVIGAGQAMLATNNPRGGAADSAAVLVRASR